MTMGAAPSTDLADWMARFARPDRLWYAKRLSGNDTLATGAHQAGPYVPRDFLISLFPSLSRPGARNPDAHFDVVIDSHSHRRRARVVWYNNRRRGGTRNEARLTRFGGRSSPLLDPESTGGLVVFAFRRMPGADCTECRIWLCSDPGEEEIVESLIGPVEPVHAVIWSPEHGRTSHRTATPTECWLQPHSIPPEWIKSFPSGKEILKKAVELRPGDRILDPDTRLLRRRDCEYEVFQSLEEAVELPGIRAGFDSVAAFVARANSILQRRKVRSGRSLELHARQILCEEGLREGRHFSHGVESEPGNKPDFLFPSQAHYRDSGFPDGMLRMLAVKTTCKDRWRQVLKEADRIPTKHLLTLQEGVSVNQFRQMTAANVRLVVPARHITRFPEEVRPELTTFGSFIDEVRSLTRSRSADRR